MSDEHEVAITLLGIDACDHELAQRWNCHNLLLESHQPIQTFSHSLDIPATLEVWPTIATGEPPQNHGIELAERQWNSRALRAASNITEYLPHPIRYQLGELAKTITGSELASPTTDSTSVFNDGGVVRNWPGITSCRDWSQAGEWFSQVTRGHLPESKFKRLEFGNAGKQIGWLASQSKFNVSIAGAHVHALDHLGHAFASRPEQLRQSYQRLDRLVGWLRETVPRLVILSDHGMQSTALGDADPGVHSWRSYIATDWQSDQLPESVFDIRAWLKERKPSVGSEKRVSGSVDAPTEHLQDLGYLD